MTQLTTAYAVILRTDAGSAIASLAKTPECAVRGVSPLEGACVLGLATIALEPEPISGMRYVLREVGPNAAPVVLARGQAAECAAGDALPDESPTRPTPKATGGSAQGSTEIDHLRAAVAAGCRIQVWRLVKDAASSGDGHWVTLTAPEFACPAHLYRVHPEDAQRAPSAHEGQLVDEYQQFVNDAWFARRAPDDNDLRNLYIMTVGLGGEAGEVQELLKKHVRDGNLDVEDLVFELGDVLYYATRIASWFGRSLREVIDANKKKLIDRQKNGKRGALQYDDVPGSWGRQSEGWPAIYDPDGAARRLVIRDSLVPYGSYVTVGNKLRLERQEYVDKVRAALTPSAQVSGGGEVEALIKAAKRVEHAIANGGHFAVAEARTELAHRVEVVEAALSTPQARPHESLRDWSLRMAEKEAGQEVRAGSFGIPDEQARPDGGERPRIPTRPRCHRCQRYITIDTDADDDLWQEVIGPLQGPGYVCADCFTRAADERLIAWEGRLRLVPLSLSVQTCIQAEARAQQEAE